jgi:hypothetical protein
VTLISNRQLQGQPTLPYTDNIIWAGQDIFPTLTFVDRTQTPVVPTSLMIEIDDLTNAVSMFGPYTCLSAGGVIPTQPIGYPAFASTMLFQLPASLMQMTYPFQGSQIVQIKWKATALDSVTGNSFQIVKVDIISLCEIATVSGF